MNSKNNKQCQIDDRRQEFLCLFNFVVDGRSSVRLVMRGRMQSICLRVIITALSNAYRWEDGGTTGTMNRGQQGDIRDTRGGIDREGWMGFYSSIESKIMSFQLCFFRSYSIYIHSAISIASSHGCSSSLFFFFIVFFYFFSLSFFTLNSTLQLCLPQWPSDPSDHSFFLFFFLCYLLPFFFLLSSFLLFYLHPPPPFLVTRLTQTHIPFPSPSSSLLPSSFAYTLLTFIPSTTLADPHTHFHKYTSTTNNNVTLPTSPQTIPVIPSTVSLGKIPKDQHKRSLRCIPLHQRRRPGRRKGPRQLLCLHLPHHTHFLLLLLLNIPNPAPW